jgi:hypothetical protein
MGKVPPAEWSAILSRHEQGESFASIARRNGRSPTAVAKSGRPQADEPTISPALRERVDSDLASFIVAFDAVARSDTPEHRDRLLEATDRLLRTGARTRIELARKRSSRAG